MKRETYGSGSNMMMVGGLLLVVSLPNIDFVL